jgi:phage shock protein A
LVKLNEDVGALQIKIKDAKARQNAIVVRSQAAQTRLGVRRTLSDHNIDDAMNRFALYERKMDELEGQIESYDLGQKTLSEEIDQLETGDEIDDMLVKLKQQMLDTEKPSETKQRADEKRSLESDDNG